MRQLRLHVLSLGLVAVFGVTLPLSGEDAFARQLVKRDGRAALTVDRDTGTDDAGDTEASTAPKSRLSNAQLQAGKAYVGSWSGQGDEMPKNGKWSIRNKAD